MAEAAKPATRCPICRKPSADRFTPFCTARCADIDLGRWLTEGYATPGGSSDVPSPEDAQ